MSESYRRRLWWSVGVILLLVGSVTFGADDTFNVSIDSSGQAGGGGSGHAGGEWYYYPSSGWYCQWFYNGPFEPTGQKRIEWSVRVRRIDTYATARLTIAINWSTDQWESNQKPPLPGDVSGQTWSEDQVIHRETVWEGTVSGTLHLNGFVQVHDYCPAWVSFDVKGVNVQIDQGTVAHTCEVQLKYDYADAPDPPYPTLKVNNGAAHSVDNQVYLGSRIDAEADGLPTAGATGNDNDNLDDEDGVTFTSALVPGANADVDVEASAFGILNAWIDFNGDGDWSDAGEQIFTDEFLIGGVNSLTFAVPAGTTPGETYARFRFSSASGLSYTGQAFNGEVEDHVATIEPKKLDGMYLKWQQPPIEYDPLAHTPVYCGWDQPAYVVVQGDYGGGYTPWSEWKIVADDFRCLGSMPITSVHWWGSYVGWNHSDYPSERPTAFVLGFWSNVPAGQGTTFSHPGKLLKAVAVGANQVDEVWVGEDRFPQKTNDACYKYTVYLNPNQYFWQGEFKDVTNDDVFWLSITALYQGAHMPSYPWGWKTRPAHWLDDAVVFSLTTSDFSAGLEPTTNGMQPSKNSAVCQPESYDTAFLLDTDPEYVKWDQPFTGLRDWAHYEDQVSMASGAGGDGVSIKWEQPPDLSGNGVDIDATRDVPRTWPPQILADDFECKTPGRIATIDLWGSWFSDYLSGADASKVQLTLNIHKDIPASQSHTGYSMPGQILWTETFNSGEFSVSKVDADLQPFYSPCTKWYIPNNHRDVYKYTFHIDQQYAFQQTGTAQQPVVYWLSVQAYLTHPAGSIPTRWGWKTSTREWNDVAVYAQSTDAANADWKVLEYPSLHAYYGRKVGLSFEIITAGYDDDSLSIQYLVADDWLCNSPYPITAAAWWGSYLGYVYRTCECQDYPPPKKPDYFWLSLWTDVPDDYPNDPSTYSKPGELVWQYKAYDYDEVLVGFDKHPEGPDYEGSYEPVYRYSARIPEQYWFYQPGKKQVYWFSVVAVYSDLSSIPYDWGWTNHPHVYNDDAVTSVFPFKYPGGAIVWAPLYDQTGATEDMSFTLFTDPQKYTDGF